MERRRNAIEGAATHKKCVVTQINFRNSEYDQEIPQSQIAEKPLAPRGKATQQS